MTSLPQEQKETSTSGLSIESVYHEKQSRWRCGLHAVNALLRRQAFTPADFDEIADSLVFESRKPWSHPHRSVFGMGDYDANVLLVALEKEGFSSTWISGQDDIRTFLEKETLAGFLVNVEAKSWIYQVLKYILEEGRHWIAVPRYPDGFFLVDSKAQLPSRFRSETELVEYLEEVRENVGHMLAIEKISPETRAQ